MKRKLILLAFMALFITPCYAQLNKEAIRLYKQNGCGLMRPVYLTIRLISNTYDLYFATDGGVIGKYERKGDTILLTPKYEYSSEIKEVVPQSTFVSVPLIFLKKGAKLIDITPYESYPVFDGWLTGDYRYKFHQIK